MNKSETHFDVKTVTHSDNQTGEWICEMQTEWGKQATECCSKQSAVLWSKVFLSDLRDEDPELRPSSWLSAICLQASQSVLCTAFVCVRVSVCMCVCVWVWEREIAIKQMMLSGLQLYRVKHYEIHTHPLTHSDTHTYTHTQCHLRQGWARTRISSMAMKPGWPWTETASNIT